MSDLSGKLLGAYQLIEKIGQGGMAQVYRAYQQSIQREVAIKILNQNLVADETFPKRFIQEVQVVSKLQHPNILPIYDFGNDDNMLYIVMGYLSGGTLTEYIQRYPEGMPRELIMRIVNQVADGLDYAHGKGIIHRDLKPGNILMGEQDTAYIADFGVAKVTGRESTLTGDGGMVGTPAYMAPDMFDSAPSTGKVDIYALGVMVFEMLTGKLPFPNQSLPAMLAAHINQPIPRVQIYRDSLSDEVQAIIEKAMAKTPDLRYETAKEFARDLNAALADPMKQSQPVRKTLSASIPRTAKSLNKNLLISGVALLVVAAFGLGYFFYNGGNINPSSEAHIPTKFIADDGTIRWTFGCLGTAEDAIQNLNCRQITNGIENRYIPFSYIKKTDGYPAGLDYDMWWEICTRLHCEPIFVEQQWDGLLDNVGAGKFDVASGGVSITDERKKFLSFSTSYMNVEQTLIVKKGEKRFTNITEFAKNADLTIGAQSGSLNAEVAESYVPIERVRTFDEYSVLIYSLTVGEVDAAVVDRVAGQKTVSGIEPKQADLIETLGASLSSDQLGIAMTKDIEIVDAINAALADMRGSGILDAIIAKYYDLNFKLTYDEVELGAYDE